MKKVFCAALIIFGICLDTYFYAFRFLADGLPVVVAISAGVSLELLLAFAVFNARTSKIFLSIAIIITAYAVIQTSAGQTFALLSHNADAGVQIETDTTDFALDTCKKNVTRLTQEANTIQNQLQSLRSANDRAIYADTISRANRRLDEISREQAQDMNIILKMTTSSAYGERSNVDKKSIYSFYASMPSWKGDAWLKFIFHFALSVLLAIMCPVGIVSWGTRTAVEQTYTRQQIEMFVAAAWYKIRNNTGANILSEIEYSGLLQRRGHAVDAGIYFVLTNKCLRAGLINTNGFALEKDHQKVIKILAGEKVNFIDRCITWTQNKRQSLFSRKPV